MIKAASDKLINASTWEVDGLHWLQFRLPYPLVGNWGGYDDWPKLEEQGSSCAQESTLLPSQKCAFLVPMVSKIHLNICNFFI